MKVTLLGVKKLDFKDDAGNAVKGTTIHYSYQDGDENLKGLAVEHKFVKDDVLGIDPFAFVGKQIDIEYGRKDKIIAVTAV